MCVTHSVHWQGEDGLDNTCPSPLPWTTPGPYTTLPGQHPSPYQPGNTVNVWTLSILLECILVCVCLCSLPRSNTIYLCVILIFCHLCLKFSNCPQEKIKSLIPNEPAIMLKYGTLAQILTMKNVFINYVILTLLEYHLHIEQAISG